MLKVVSDNSSEIITTDSLLKNHTKTIEGVAKLIKDIYKTKDDLTLSLGRFNVLDSMLGSLSSEFSENLNTILDKITEINSKIFDLANLDTDYTRKYIAVQMLNPAGSTFRILKQILSQIESLQRNIKSSIRAIKLINLDIYDLFNKLDNLNDSTFDKVSAQIEREKILIKIDEKLDKLADVVMSLNISIRDLKLYVELYNQVKKNKNIPDSWSKEDLEIEEYKHHVRNAFRLAIRDVISSTRLSSSTCEYLENIGISPIKAINLIRQFLSDSRSEDIEFYYEFLDSVAELFKDNIKLVDMKIGYDLETNTIDKDGTSECTKK